MQTPDNDPHDKPDPAPPTGTETDRHAEVADEGVDPDAPGATLFNEDEDAVEPNEPA